MKLRRIISLTVPLLLYGTAVFAATSGFVGIDQPLTGFGNIMQNGVGYAMGIGGGALCAHHFITGKHWGDSLWTGAGWGIGGAVCHNAAIMSGTFGGAAAALIKLVA